MSSTERDGTSFEYLWAIEQFSAQVISMCHHHEIGGQSGVRKTPLGSLNVLPSGVKNNGFDSKPFCVELNGVCTEWNLSMRFMVGKDDEKVKNPVIFCLNLLPFSEASKGLFDNLTLEYEFAFMNHQTSTYEIIGRGSSTIVPGDGNDMRSIVYKTIIIRDVYIDFSDQISFRCKMDLNVARTSYAVPPPAPSYISGEKYENTKFDLVIESHDGKKFEAHRSVLCTKSPVFNKSTDEHLFEITQTPHQETKDNLGENAVECIKAKRLNSESLEEMLHFIYKHSLINAEKCAKNMIKIADLYKLPELKSYCELYLATTLCPQNIAEILLIANSHTCSRLKKSVLKYCKTYCDNIFKDNGWKQIEEQEPMLYEEVVMTVIGDEYSLCEKHLECLRKRYNKSKFSKLLCFK